MTLNSVSVINVKLMRGAQSLPAGRLAIKDGRVFFEYDADFIKSGIELSPFELPLRPGVFMAGTDTRIFDGLFGLFNDSLPDGWGRLLLDRKMRTQGVAPETLTVLDRLACVGANGMGALVYEPGYANKGNNEILNIGVLAQQAHEILDGGTSDVLEKLLVLNGGSAGARPKITVGVDANKNQIIHGSDQLPRGYTAWLIKFRAKNDDNEIGAVEYAYSLMAKEAGIRMPETCLFRSDADETGYFGVQRFDRDGDKRIHMHTASGLLHADHRSPSLDYESLLKAALVLTKSVPETEVLFRQAVFNVMAYNRDDHAKNFSFLLDEENVWRVAPAYDLVFSSGPGGEHSTSIMGEGKNPGKTHLKTLGKKLGLKNADKIIGQVEEAVSRWKKFAKEAGVSKQAYEPIQNEIDKIISR